MNKKYKCIKSYPSHGRQWKVGDICDSKGTSYTYELAPEWPEFWEEVVELDYEILSFKYGNGCPYYYTLRDNGMYSSSGHKTDQYNLEKHLEDVKNVKCIIYSIKRLSDGEVFTIGDNIDIGKNKNDTIESFELCEYGVRVKIKRNANYKTYGAKLSIVQHCKKPLLTTEDGVDVFEGDKYYWYRKLSINSVGENFAIKKKYAHDTYLYFSTHEAILKYIEENKPQFSKKDIMDILECDFFTDGECIDKLYELINGRN